jgi:hypothetical protein
MPRPFGNCAYSYRNDRGKPVFAPSSEGLGQCHVVARVDQLEPVDREVVVLEQVHGRPPALPA